MSPDFIVDPSIVFFRFILIFFLLHHTRCGPRGRVFGKGLSHASVFFPVQGLYLYMSFTFIRLLVWTWITANGATWPPQPLYAPRFWSLSPLPQRHASPTHPSPPPLFIGQYEPAAPLQPSPWPPVYISPFLPPPLLTPAPQFAPYTCPIQTIATNDPPFCSTSSWFPDASYLWYILDSSQGCFCVYFIAGQITNAFFLRNNST